MLLGIIYLIIGITAQKSIIRRHKPSSATDPILSLFPLVSGSNANVQQARQVLLGSPCYPLIKEVHEMTNAQLDALHIMDNNYVTQSHIIDHRKWHTDPLNGIGGTLGEGSGTALGGMHMQMLKQYELWIGPSWKRPYWNPKLQIPIQLSIDKKFASLGSRINNDPQYDEPIFFHGIDPFTGLSSNDFLTPDDYWRAIGLRVHASPHYLVGGPMNDSSISPTDWSSFIGWHSYLQRQFETWLQSRNGIQWSQNNRFHALLSTSTTDVALFKNSKNFIGDGVCKKGNLLPICIQLQTWQDFVNPLG